MPKVSICVPNLNCRPFLRERFETIFKQTLEDWELIVCDSYSDDGAWEYIQELASREPRMRISQTPRNGIYAGFNDCIGLGRAEYVYIATSDDTMMPDCLAKMVATLDSHPDCGLCQCELVIIDENGLPMSPAKQWNHYTLGSYDQSLVSKKNKRMAPHDGIAHPALFTIYTSVTQLLIRRSVFDRIGLFDGRWGSISDFEWEMAAGLVENCIYIPEKLATWRLHSDQATQNVHTAQARLKMIEMTRAAFARIKTNGYRGLDGIDIEDIIYFLERDIVDIGWKAAEGKATRLRFLLEQFGRRPRPVVDHVLDYLRKNKWGFWNSANRYDRLNSVLRKYGVLSPVFE
jgi:glycosyltransferase involved in cell wall biosynthesis